MTMHEASVSLGHHGGGQVIVDGIDIGRMVTSAVIRASYGEMPRLELELIFGRITADGKMMITMDDKSRVALQALGWTPPPGDES